MSQKPLAGLKSIFFVLCLLGFLTPCQALRSDEPLVQNPDFLAWVPLQLDAGSPASVRGTLRTKKQVSSHRKVALVVGVDDYKRFSDLRFAEADVQAVGQELEQLGFQVISLLGAKATRSNILGTVDQLVDRLDTEDLIVVMLAGHGQQISVTKPNGETTEDAYFCPYDGAPNSPEKLCSLSYLVDEQLNVGKRILIVDACRDVSKVVQRGIQGRVIALPEDFAILFSCRAGQQSFEHQDLGHGIFTQALLNALRGGAARAGEAKIVWSSVVSYVDWEMASEEFRAYTPPGKPQVPISAGSVPFTVLGEADGELELPGSVENTQPAFDAYLINSVGMKMISIPPGTFAMGSPLSEPGRDEDEHPHNVQITKGFYMGVYEVTQAEYSIVKNAKPSYFKMGEGGEEYLAGNLTDQLPVEQVSWLDASDFCLKLSQIEEEVLAGRRYRLPTEAEWEYACRGGAKTHFNFGNAFSSAAANADGRFPYQGNPATDFLRRTADVATFFPNSFGLYNMHGNVSEWCSDWYSARYYQDSPSADPAGPATGSSRVVRGGSWFDSALMLRSADRHFAEPYQRKPFNGFRVVCEKR